MGFDALAEPFCWQSRASNLFRFDEIQPCFVRSRLEIGASSRGRQP